MRLLLALLLLEGAVFAHEPPPPNQRKWHLGIEAMTDFPLSVGVQVWAELPYRIRLTMSMGEMPDPYLSTINSIAVSAGAYNQSQANLITELLDRATTFRTQVGWRPFRNRGGYAELGFGVMELYKSLALADVISLATGVPIPQEANIGLGYEANTVVETLGVELGWMWYPWRDLTVRVGVGFAAPVGVQVSITPNFASTLQQPFTKFAEDYSADLLKKHLIVPTVSLAVGWRLY
jgi:hypothetical protein